MGWIIFVLKIGNKQHLGGIINKSVFTRDFASNNNVYFKRKRKCFNCLTLLLLFVYLYIIFINLSKRGSFKVDDYNLHFTYIMCVYLAKICTKSVFLIIFKLHELRVNYMQFIRHFLQACLNTINEKRNYVTFVCPFSHKLNDNIRICDKELFENLIWENSTPENFFIICFWL